MLALWSNLRDAWRAFCNERSGNVAVTFAMATLPIIGGVGAAVDYSRANAVKASLQAALDSTALMLSREAATDSADQLQTNALKYFKANYTPANTNDIAVSASYTTNGGTEITVNASVDVPTVFMGIMGYTSITVNGSSTAKWGSQRLRVALALDNTGSMAQDGKMTALKSATKALLDQLKAAATKDGDVYVSIIPFSKDVNVGNSKTNRSADWLDWSLWDEKNGDCSDNNYKTKSSCESHHKTWTADKHKNWNGCVTDRDDTLVPGTTYDYDQSAENPDPKKPASLFPAEQYDQCPVAMMGLNYAWTDMTDLVNSMTPNGNTNQPIGLVWGWQSLVGGGPLTAPAKDPNYEYQDVIVLMSDGLNTENRWSSSQSAVDRRMYDSSQGGAGTCANIKAAKVTIYAVQVNTGGDPLSTLLKNCASSSEKFWMITNANDLKGVFQQIGTNLTQLRVAK
jgi:Flp pilus assembly protein TadG